MSQIKKANASIFSFQKTLKSQSELRNTASAGASPPTGSSIASFQHDSTDIFDDPQAKTTTNRKTSLNLQIPKRIPKTPSPKGTISKSKEMMKAYHTNAKSVKSKSKNTANDQTKTKSLAELPTVLNKKFELELKIAELQLELQREVIQHKKLKERRLLVLKMQETLTKVLEENEDLKHRIRNKDNYTPEEPKNSMTKGGNLLQIMDEFKRKFVKLLGVSLSKRD